MRILSAPLVFPVASPPVLNGAVLIDGRGLVAEVGGDGDIIAANPRVPVTRYEDSILLPALVNCHTHLELGALSPIGGEIPFAEWILAVISRKRAAAPEDFARGMREGALDCLGFGQGLLADVTSAPGAERHYPADGPLVAHFSELIATSPQNAPSAVASLLERTPSGNSYRGGLFAHAPYTVCKEGYEAALRESLKMGGRLYTHLAESRDELEFAAFGGGEIVTKVYGNLPVSPPPAFKSHPVDWLFANGLLGDRTVAVHAVNVNESHVGIFARSKTSLVLCPRSNRNLRVGTAPGRKFLDAGITVGLGTDSLLSAGDLDLWKDMLAAVDAYGWSPREALFAATMGGARVLGREAESGALTAGRKADILVRGIGDGADPWEKAMTSPSVRAVLISGREVFST